MSDFLPPYFAPPVFIGLACNIANDSNGLIERENLPGMGVKMKNTKLFTIPGIIKYLCAIILLSVFAVSPLLNDKWILVGESIEQILRVIELDRGLNEGYLYPRWFGDLAGGFGYPYFVFYSPLIYYVAEFFLLLGFSIIASLKCMVILGIILSGVGMFILARSFWGSYGALVSAIAYIYVPYRMVNLYIRGDFAEAFAMAIFPFILFFFYKLILKKSLLYLSLSAISFAALILTHNCSALIFSGFLTCFILFFSLQSRSWAGVCRGLLSIMWALCLSAVFWLPALWEKELVNIHLIYSNAAVDFHNNFVDLFQLFHPGWTFDGGIGGHNLPFQLGNPQIVLMIISLGVIIKIDASERIQIRESTLFLAVSIIAVVFLMTSSSSFFWESIQIMRYLQFPWRLLSLLSLLISIMCGALFYYFKKESIGVQQVLLVPVIMIIVFSGAQQCRVKGYYTNISNDDRMAYDFVKQDRGTISAYNTTEMDKVIDYGEYLPKTVKILPNKEKAGQVYSTDGTVVIEDLKTRMQEYEFLARAEVNSEIVVGSFYYPSWTGYIDNEDLSLFTDAEGLIHFIIPKGEHKIRVFFGDTAIRNISKYISLVSFIIFSAALFLICIRQITTIRGDVNHLRRFFSL